MINAIRRIVSFGLIIVLLLGYTSCGEGTAKSSEINENDASVSEKNNPLIGEWRLIELDDDGNELYEGERNVLIIKEDDEFLFTFEKPSKCAYLDDNMVFYETDSDDLDYYKYSIEKNNDGYILRPIFFCWKGKEYDVEEYKNNMFSSDEEQFRKIQDLKNNDEYPSIKVKPIYEITPYEGPFESALEEYEIGMKISEHHSMNLWAKTIQNCVGDYEYSNALDDDQIESLCGMYTSEDKDTELLSEISQALAESDEKIEYCIGAIWNEKAKSYNIFAQARKSGSDIVGQYPGGFRVEWDNTEMLTDIVFGEYYEQ